MKRYALVLWMSLLLPVSLIAQKDMVNNHFGLSIEGGFSHLFLGSSLSPFNGYSTPELGYGGGGAFFYEMEYKHFIFRTGFGIDYTINNNRFNAPSYMASIEEYKGMTYRYDFSDFKETTHYGVGYVPIMLGGNFSKMFFLVGAKVGVLPFSSMTRQTAKMTISATDEDIIDPLDGLYTHDMRNYTLPTAQSKMDLNQINIIGSFEVGFNLDSKIWKEDREKRKEARDKKNGKKPKRKPFNRAEYYKKLHQKKSFKDCLHYRLSIFADYGFTNMLPSNRPTGELMTFNGLTDVKPHSMYNYSPHQNAILNNCMVGIKFAIMYEVPHRAPKKGDMANPYIVTFVRDELTDKPLAKATVTTQPVTSPRAKAKKPIVRTTDSKYGCVAKAYPPGAYFISVSHAGYISIDSLPFIHQNEYDTLRLALYPQHHLRAQAVDAMSGRSITAQISVCNDEGQIVSNGAVDSINNVFTCVVDDRKIYSVCVKAEGYKDTCIKVSKFAEVQTMSLVPLRLNRFVLKNMFFATNKTKILPNSETALQDLYKLLKDNPDVHIRIIGHTDDVGKEEYNQKLSEGRSRSVKQEMVRRGIDAKRIETTGRGEKEPIVPNDSDQHRQMNRRVEVEIIQGELH